MTGYVSLHNNNNNIIHTHALPTPNFAYLNPQPKHQHNVNIFSTSSSPNLSQVNNRAVSPVDKSRTPSPSCIQFSPKPKSPENESPEIVNLRSKSSPKRLFGSITHNYYADGSYANAPHPSELAPPMFDS